MQPRPTTQFEYEPAVLVIGQFSYLTSRREALLAEAMRRALPAGAGRDLRERATKAASAVLTTRHKLTGHGEIGNRLDAAIRAIREEAAK